VDQEPAAPRRSRLWRWIRRGLIALVSLILGVIVAIHLPPVERALIELGLTRLRASLGVSIDYTSIRYNLITRHVTIEGLKFGRPGGPPLVEAQRVQVSFPFTTFKGSLDGLDVTLESARCPAGPRRAALDQFPRPMDASARHAIDGAATAASVCGAEAARRGRRYEDHDANFASDTKGLRVDMVPTGDAPGHLAGPMAAGATSAFKWEPRGTSLTLLGGRAIYTPELAGWRTCWYRHPKAASPRPCGSRFTATIGCSCTRAVTCAANRSRRGLRSSTP
jgi:hypothetical protein